MITNRLINSPGVQIAERDLSLRVDSPVGTQVYVFGFAAQGPTSEPILITSASELETVFGIPTTAAEKYFYYSCREVLNSPGRLNAVRLPYGADAGSTYVGAYSGLFYPTTLTTTPSSIEVDGVKNTWNATVEVGEPKHYVLTPTQYEKIVKNQVTWAGTEAATTGTFTDAAGVITINAGFVILNEMSTVVNDSQEGLYIGMADNTSALEKDYVSITKIKSLNTNSVAGTAATFVDVSTTRLDFLLSATNIQSEQGTMSVSETLEKTNFIGWKGQDYIDSLNIGVFKLRKSITDSSKLSIGPSEIYLGALNSNKTETTSGGTTATGFIANKVNQASPQLEIAVHPTLSRVYDWDKDSTSPNTRIKVAETARGLYPLGVYVPVSAGTTTTKTIGNIDLKLNKIFTLLENPEKTTIDILCDSGLSTISATVKYTSALTPPIADFDDQYYIQTAAGVLGTAYKDAWSSIVNKFIIFAEQTRKDCVAIVDLPRQVFVKGQDTKTLDLIADGSDAPTFTTSIKSPLLQLTGPLESAYAACYGNWVKIVDMFSGNPLWLPFSSYAAAVYARSDAAANVWAAPAGFNRGEFQNAVDIAINPNQAQRDTLYELGINPVVYFIGDGYTIFGQKTLQSKPTAFDRINVRRLFLALERAVSRTVKYFVFEPNTEFTRKRVKDTISPIFNYAKTTQGIYDYMIVCDDRNNGPDVVDDNSLIVDIYIKPVRTAEFILVNFIATRTGQNFQELI
jgi:phage tail sheath protein FI